jgi:hypothetical protein
MYVKLPRLRSLFAPFASQSGVGQIILMVLLLAGVAVGTYVVQNRTNLIPHASEDNSCNDDTYYCEGDKKIHKTGGYQDENGECVYDYQDAGSCSDSSDQKTDSDSSEKDCKNAGGTWKDDRCYTAKSSKDSCGYDQQSKQYSCSNGQRCYEDFFKDDSTGCKWQYKDPHYHCDKDDKCSDDTKNNSDNSEEDCKKAGGEWKENRCFTASVSKGGTSEPGNNASTKNDKYDQGDCRDGAQSYKDGYAWIAYCSVSCTQNSDCAQNTSDGAVDPKTSNWCYGFNNGKAPRCMKLVQTDNKEVGDSKRKEANTKAVENIKTTLAQGGNPNPTTQQPTQSSSVELRAKVDAQNKQRSDLIGEMATVINKSGGTNSTVNAEISRAQNLLTEAAAKATSCYTGTDKPLSDACDADAQAANDIAVAASRVALFDAVAIGVPDTCVKVDMAVGNNSTNSLIEVTPASGGTSSRLFMCRGRESKIGAKDGVIIWQVRDDQGKLQNVSQTSLDKLNLKTGQTNPSSIPEDFISRRNNAAKLTNQPAYSASSASSSQSNEWKEVAVNNCLSNCSSFPSGAVCYQKGTTSQYNCDGKKPTTTTNSTTPTTTTTKKDLPSKATCSENKECKSGQCNPGTSKCL